MAAGRVGRDPANVRIVAVTKTFPPAVVDAAVRVGLTDVGENYVQEAEAKQGRVAEPASWHLIGGLQRNKAGVAARLFDRIHTVDSIALAHALGRGARGRRLAVLIQVNLQGRAPRRGIAPEGVPALAQAILAEPALMLDGMMVLPEPGGEAATRACFRSLRELRDLTATRLGVELPHLSMGMSNDFAVAVEEGATWIRLGRVLFGARHPAGWRPGSSVGGEGS